MTRIGTDTGGTFTDLVAADGTIVKVPSTREDPGEAVRRGTAQLLALVGERDGDPGRTLEALAHGTTVATNALLERRGGVVTLITNEGGNMRIHYGTAAEGGSQEHTGTQVRVAAQGPGGAGVVGVIDQTDLFRLMQAAMADGGTVMPGLPTTGQGGSGGAEADWFIRPATLLALLATVAALGRRRRNT